MCSPLVGAREWKDDFDKRGSRPRKIGFSDKDVAKEIHVSLAQINIAVVHEPDQPLEIQSVSRVYSYYARCKQHSQSPYHDSMGLTSMPNAGGLPGTPRHKDVSKQLHMAIGDFFGLRWGALKDQEQNKDYALIPGSDILGVCHIKKDSTEVRYFVVLGVPKHEPERDILGAQIDPNDQEVGPSKPDPLTPTEPSVDI